MPGGVTMGYPHPILKKSVCVATQRASSALRHVKLWQVLLRSYYITQNWQALGWVYLMQVRISLPYHRISADKAGIGLKRAQRAIKLLVRAGYLK